MRKQWNQWRSRPIILPVVLSVALASLLGLNRIAIAQSWGIGPENMPTANNIDVEN